MSGKRKAWTSLQDISHRYSLEELDAMQTDRIYANTLYTVNVKRHPPVEGWPSLIHLSMKRNDKSHRGHDWRDMQRIKTEICGAECEGVELFPAESRVVDCSNQYHLWVIEKPGLCWPFGFGERLVAEGVDRDLRGKSRQRAWRPGLKPRDALSPKRIASKMGQYQADNC